MMQAIGFWRGPDDRSLIHPKHIVDADWRPDDRAHLAQYLRSGSPACAYTISLSRGSARFVQGAFESTVVRRTGGLYRANIGAMTVSYRPSAVGR